MNTVILPAKLLAKTKRGDREVTLEQHLQQTAECADLIFDAETRVGRNFLAAFRIATDSEIAEFQLNLAVACLLHDIGKANESFMAAISRKGEQVVRHEHLSAIFMTLPEVKAWLHSGSQLLNFPIILGAVLSHHLKADQNNLGQMPAISRSTPLFFEHPEVHAILQEVSRRAVLQAPPVVPHRRFNYTKPPWSDAIAEIERLGSEIGRICRGRSDPKLMRHLAATKVALIVADSVASALVRESLSLKDWIQDNVHIDVLSKDMLIDKVIAKRKANIERRTGKKFEEHDFQVAVAQQGRKAAVVAGCGTGKTLAGLLWCANQLAGDRFGRLIFLYPTRGTATEGFRDYIGWAPEEEAELLHSSSRYELQAIMDNPSDATQGKTYRESDERLFALASYDRRFFSSTVDPILELLGTRLRQPMQGSPAY